MIARRMFIEPQGWALSMPMAADDIVALDPCGYPGCDGGNHRSARDGDIMLRK